MNRQHPAKQLTILFLFLLLFVSVTAKDSGQNDAANIEIDDEPTAAQNMKATNYVRETKDNSKKGEKKEKRKVSRAEMEELAKAADNELFHLTHDDFSPRVSKDTWFVFFGAKWCKYCQRLTLKWRKLQGRVHEKLQDEYKFNVAKVDCTQDEEFCGKYGIDGYPTMILYNKGKPIEEYSSEQDVASMYKYAKAMARKYFKYSDEHDEL